MELSLMMELFYICTIQNSSHWLHVAIERLKCSQCDWRTEFLILFNFTWFKFKFKSSEIKYKF